jgi:Uma2 family endonuclease
MSMAQPIFESINTLEPAEFAAWVEARERLGDPDRYELLSGRVVVSPPAGWPHGEIEAAVATLLGAHVRAHGLGRTFGSSQGFELPTGDTVAPDVSVVSAERWSTTTPITGKFLRVVPELVVEILSESTASRDRGEKKGIYGKAGVLEYWIVDTRARTVTVFTGDGERFDAGRILSEREELQSRVLPALQLLVASLF